MPFAGSPDSRTWMTSGDISAIIAGQGGAGVAGGVPALMQGLFANPYTVRGMDSIIQMAPAMAGLLIPPETPILGQFTQAMAGRAGLMTSLGHIGFPGGRGPMGMGFGLQERQALTQVAQQVAPEATMGELAQLVSGGAAMGAFQGVRSVQEFRSNFQQLVNAVREVTRALNTTLEDSLALMNEVRGMGLLRPGMQAAGLEQIQGAAYGAGMRPSDVIGAVRAMIPSLRQAGGMTQAQAARTGLESLGRMGLAYQEGFIGDEQLLASTGLTAAEGGIPAMAATLGPRMAGRLRGTPRGQWLSAAMFDPTTMTIDPERLEQLRAGTLTPEDVQRFGAQGVGQIGQAQWMVSRNRIAGELGAQEPYAEAAFYRGVLHQRGLTTQDPRGRIMMQRLGDMSQEELETMIPIVENLPQIEALQGLRDIEARHAQQRANAQVAQTPQWLQTMQQRIRDGVNAVTDYANRAAQSVSERIETFVNDRFSQVFGGTSTPISEATLTGALRGGGLSTDLMATARRGFAAGAAATMPTAATVTGGTLEEQLPQAYARWSARPEYYMPGATNVTAAVGALREQEAALRTRAPGEYLQRSLEAQEYREALVLVQGSMQQQGRSQMLDIGRMQNAAAALDNTNTQEGNRRFYGALVGAGIAPGVNELMSLGLVEQVRTDFVGGRHEMGYRFTEQARGDQGAQITVAGVPLTLTGLPAGGERGAEIGQFYGQVGAAVRRAGDQGEEVQRRVRALGRQGVIPAFGTSEQFQQFIAQGATARYESYQKRLALLAQEMDTTASGAQAQVAMNLDIIGKMYNRDQQIGEQATRVAEEQKKRTAQWTGPEVQGVVAQALSNATGGKISPEDVGQMFRDNPALAAAASKGDAAKALSIIQGTVQVGAMGEAMEYGRRLGERVGVDVGTMEKLRAAPSLRGAGGALNRLTAGSSIESLSQGFRELGKYVFGLEGAQRTEALRALEEGGYEYGARAMRGVAGAAEGLGAGAGGGGRRRMGAMREMLQLAGVDTSGMRTSADLARAAAPIAGMGEEQLQQYLSGRGGAMGRGQQAEVMSRFLEKYEANMQKQEAARKEEQARLAREQEEAFRKGVAPLTELFTNGTAAVRVVNLPGGEIPSEDGGSGEGTTPGRGARPAIGGTPMGGVGTRMISGRRT